MGGEWGVGGGGWGARRELRRGEKVIHESRPDAAAAETLTHAMLENGVSEQVHQSIIMGKCCDHVSGVLCRFECGQNYWRQ